MSLWLIFLIFFFIFIMYKFVFVAMKRMNFYKKQGLRTEFTPLVGSLIMGVQNSLKKHNDAIYDLKVLAQKEPNLKVIVRNFGATPVVILLDPALKKDFAFAHSNYDAANVFGNFAKVFAGGLTGVQGDTWKKQRKIIGQSFHFEFIKDNIPRMVSITRQLLKEMSERKLNGVKILEENEKIAGENVGVVFFSENLKKYTIKGQPVSTFLTNSIVKIGKAFMSPGYLIWGAKYIEKGLFASHRELLDDFKQIEKTCHQILSDRKNSDQDKKDLAWFLLESQKNAKEEDRLSDFEIISNYATFITAGTGTTSNVVSMTLYSLTQYPEVLQKLKKEVKEIYNKEDPVSLDSLNKMNYLTGCLKETLRMYNPTGIGPGFKEASQNHKIGTIEIQKGTRVVASLLHSDFSEIYFENPLSYDPQRWIEKPSISEAYAYTPFWAGPRNCIGQHMAMIEAKIIVCEFLNKFDFALVKDYKLKLSTTKGYGPEGDILMNLTPRSELL